MYSVLYVKAVYKLQHLLVTLDVQNISWMVLVNNISQFSVKRSPSVRADFHIQQRIQPAILYTGRNKK